MSERLDHQRRSVARGRNSARLGFLDLGRNSDFESALTEIENLYLNELMKTEDATEGVQSFMEKRKPEWRNK